MNEDLDIKYRPDSLKSVLGQKAIVKSINDLHKDNKLPHSFLFHGPSGVGKTTMARIIAKLLKCNKNSINEFDAASFSGVDDVRGLVSKLSYQGIGSENKVYIIDECHALSKNAWQALLKPIEEPPSHVYFVLCTTEENKVPKTIKTRCHSYGFKEASFDNLFDLLSEINEEEEFELDDGLLEYIAKQSTGSYRQAVKNLSACRDATDKKEVAGILSTVLDKKEIIDFCRYIVKGGDFKGALKLVTTMTKDGANAPESIRIVAGIYVSAVILKNPGNNLHNLLNILAAFSTPYNTAEKNAPLILSLADVYFD